MIPHLSLRTRITIGSTIVVVVLLIAASIAVYAQLSSILVAREKAVLHGIAEVYSAVIRQDPDRPLEKPGVGQHVAILAPDGDIRMDTLSADLRSRLDELAAPGPVLREVSSDGHTYFLYTKTVSTDAGEWTILVTRDTDISADVLSTVVGLLWTLLIAAGVLFALGSWVVSTAALRPVERLRRSAERLALGGQDELLPARPDGDELDALAHTLNELIESLRAASARERQMVADASHELRNPLAVLRAQLDILDDSDPDPQLLDEARATLSRVIRLSDSLLQLSQAEAADVGGTATLAALAEEAVDRVDRLRWRIAEPSSTLHGEIDLDIERAIAHPDAANAPVVDIDATDFGRVLDNLIDNALRSSATRSVHVTVSIRQVAQLVDVTVTDDGDGFAPEIAARAFQRFTRATTPHYQGGGLGLAIVARVAELAGGSVSIAPPPTTVTGSTVASGASVTVRLPIRRVDGFRSPNTQTR